MILKGDEGETLGVILTKEERNHEMITTVVRLQGRGRSTHRRLRLAITHEGVVHTLDKEGIKLADLLATNPELKLGGIRSSGRE